MRHTVRRLIPALLASSALAALAWGGNDTFAVAKRKLHPAFTFRATLGAEPLQEIRFMTEAYGQPLPVLEAVPAGAHVHKGDLLLRLDTLHLDEAIRDAEVSVHNSEESLRISTCDGKAQEISGRSALAAAEVEFHAAENRLSTFREMQVPNRKRGGELELQSRQHGIEDQQEELQQLESMYNASELAHDTKEIVLKRARRGLESSRARLELAQKENAVMTDRDLPQEEAQLVSALDQRRAALESARISRKSQADRKAMELANAQRELDKAREHLDRLKADKTRATVLAEADGMIIHASGQSLRSGGADLGATHLEPKEMAQPRTVLMSVLPSRADRLFGKVSLAQAARLSVGQAAAVKPTAFPGRSLKGTVTSLAELPSGRNGQDLLYDICIALDGKENSSTLVPGMDAEIRMESVPCVDEVVAVPVKAVAKEGAKSLCYVHGADGSVQPREVTVGEADEECVEIKTGLAVGDSILPTPPEKK